VLYNSSFPGAKIHVATISSAAEKLNLAVRFVEVRARSDFDAALAAILADNPAGVITIDDPLIFGYGRGKIIDFATEHKIAMVHEFREFAELGGLVSYGANLKAIWRRGVYYVDRILKGEKPSTLPVEQPTMLDLAINLKTAKALGVTFPNTLLATANVVIE